MWAVRHSCSGAALSPAAKSSVFENRLTARWRERGEKSLFDSTHSFEGISLCLDFFGGEGGVGGGGGIICRLWKFKFLVDKWERETKRSPGCQDAVWGVKDSPVLYRTLEDTLPLPPLFLPYIHLFLCEIHNAGNKCVINRGDQNNVYGLKQHWNHFPYQCNCMGPVGE